MFEDSDFDRATHPAEERSFRRLCTKHGLEPLEFIAKAKKFYQKKAEDALEDAKRSPIYQVLSGIDGLEEEFINASRELFPPNSNSIAEYFSYLRRSGYSTIAEDKSALSHIRPNSQLSEKYVAGLCSLRNMRDNGFGNNIEFLLKDIPRLFFFDTEFQGAAQIRKELGLCFIVYPHLYEVMNVAIKLLHYIVFEVNGTSFANRHKNVALGFSQDENVQICFHKLRKWAAGQEIGISYPTVIEPRAPFNLGVEYSGGFGKQFVRLHEIFHVLLGHMELEQSSENEFMADAYAFSAITLDNEGPASTVAVANGIAAFFLCDHVINGTHKGGIHPSARERVDNLRRIVAAKDLYANFTIASTVWDKINSEGISDDR
jgi:hypothetical protein